MLGEDEGTRLPAAPSPVLVPPSTDWAVLAEQDPYLGRELREGINRKSQG